MTKAAKAISGIGGLLTAVTVPSTYLALSGSKTINEGESNKPTGEKWLSDNGHTFNKPTFKSHNDLGHGCFENLFSSPIEDSESTDNPKIYGCAVMKLEVGNTGVNLFSDGTNHNINPKWVKFNSEIAIRKGSEGWVINSRVDNWTTRTTNFEYLLTEYKYQENMWSKKGESKLWEDYITMDNSAIPLEAFWGDDKNYATINIHNKKLVIKSPEEIWFQDKHWIHSASTDRAKKTQIPEITKEWSGVWIDDSDNGSDSWIFENIELCMDNKKYSQVFCGEDNCFQKEQIYNSYKTNKPSQSDTWSGVTSKHQTSQERTQDMIEGNVKTMINKLKSSKGSWKKLEDICRLKNSRDLKEEQKLHLKIYCSKKLLNKD